MTKNASVFLAYRKSQAKKSDGDGLTKKKPPFVREAARRLCRDGGFARQAFSE